MKALVFLLLLFACAQMPASPFEAARAQTFFIETAEGHGSGVAINDKCVLTVGHVLGEEKEVRLIDKNDHVTPAKLIVVDMVTDVGVACAETSLKTPVAHVAKNMPLRYAPVFTLGYPLNESQILTEGRYQLNGVVTAPIAPGNSGGGVFDADGNLIGLADTISLYNNSSIGVIAFPHIEGIVEIGTIRKFLDDNHIEYES